MKLRFLALPLVMLATSADAQAWREDWKQIPWALPVTQEHVANPMLKLELHGPGQRGIKKSHHDHIEGDPYYIWSGKCERHWAVSLSHRKSLVDLSAAEAGVRWRSRQSGDRQLHLILRLPGERWIVSDQADPTSDDWHEFEFVANDLTWRYLNIITVTAGEEVASPDLSRVDAVGFTDLATGGGSKVSSRLDWIEVSGKAVARPPRKPPAVKTSRVRPELPADVTQHLGVTYASDDQRELKLDLYVPKVAGASRLPNASSQKYPAIIFIHGGGWYKGEPSSYTPMAQQLAARGFVTANIEYRLSGEAAFPAAIHDCKSAVRWLRQNAEKYAIDPDRIGAVGGSAGGHLCGLLAATGKVDKLAGSGGNLHQSSAIQAAVIMAGPMDLSTPETLANAQRDPRRRLQTFMGGTWQEARQNYIDASPNRHIDKNTPPLCFIDGEFDKPGTRYTHTKRMLDDFGIPHQTHIIRNAPHPFWTSHPFFEPALGHVEAFFKKHL